MVHLIAVGGQRPFGRRITQFARQKRRALQRFHHLPACHPFGQRHPQPCVRRILHRHKLRRGSLNRRIKLGHLDIAVCAGIKLAQHHVGGGNPDAIIDLGATGALPVAGHHRQYLGHRGPGRDQIRAKLQPRRPVGITRAKAKDRPRCHRSLCHQIIRHQRKVRPPVNLQAYSRHQRPGIGKLALGPGQRRSGDHQRHQNQRQRVRGDVAPHQPRTLPRTNDALVPPNPNEFDSATSIRRFRATWGARSSFGCTAGLSRLMVGGAT